MMLLDTDVLADVALDRRPHSDPAPELPDRIEHGAEAAYIAWHSVSNFYFIVEPSLAGVSAREFIVELSRFAAVAENGTDGIRYAAELPMADFEDMMQVAAAHVCGARHIVKRNVRDYERSPRPCGRSPGGAQRAVLASGVDTFPPVDPAGIAGIGMREFDRQTERPVGFPPEARVLLRRPVSQRPGSRGTRGLRA